LEHHNTKKRQQPHAEMENLPYRLRIRHITGT